MLATHLETGSILITIETFLCDDILEVIGTDHRLGIAAENMFEDDIKRYPVFWVEISYTICFNVCRYEWSRTRNISAKKKAIVNCNSGSTEKEKELEL